jgi:ABC-type multidrug transport system permease subunit
MPGQGGILAVIIAVTTITSMIGGAWFPVDMAPQFFQTLGQFTPQHWFFEAVNAWQTGAGGAVGPTIVILLAAALCFVLAGIQFTANKSLSRV